MKGCNRLEGLTQNAAQTSGRLSEEQGGRREEESNIEIERELVVEQLSKESKKHKSIKVSGI